MHFGGTLATIPHYRCVAGDEVHGKHSLDTPSPASQLHFPTLIFPFLGFCHPSFGWNPACSPATLPLTPPACCKPPLTSTLLHWCEGILTLHLQLLNPLVTPPLPSHPAAPGFPAASSRHWRWVEAWAAAHRAMGTGWSQRGMKRSIKMETLGPLKVKSILFVSMLISTALEQDTEKDSSKYFYCFVVRIAEKWFRWPIVFSRIFFLSLMCILSPKGKKKRRGRNDT